MREHSIRYNWIILVRPIAHQNEQSSITAVLTGALIPSNNYLQLYISGANHHEDSSY